MDVMFYEVFKEEEKALKLFLPKDVFAEFTSKTIQAQADKKPPASLISIRTQSVIPDEWKDKLEGVLTRSVGYEHLLEYMQKNEALFLAGYLPSYCARAVAEHAVMAMLMLLRKAGRQLEQFDSFNRDGLTGRECSGKNLLVLGVGRIGSQLVDLGRGLKMTVKGVDIQEKLPELEYVPLSKGLEWADVVVCALPLTNETKGMLDYKTFSSVKKGAVFVNISRGDISPLKDLSRLLEEGRLGGISLDVYEKESSLAECLRGNAVEETGLAEEVMELKKHPNVLLTPHNAFNTEEALERKAEQSIESVQLFLQKKTFPYPVPEWQPDVFKI